MAEIVRFPTSPDISSEAREFADKLEAGEFERVDAALVITTGKHLQCLYWGNTLDVIQAIGVLETAKANLIEKLLR